jgi:hypothetical protein
MPVECLRKNALELEFIFKMGFHGYADSLVDEIK